MSDAPNTEQTRTAKPRPPIRPRVSLGETIGRFSVLSEVGSGGMGQVYEAYDPSLDRRVALKVLNDPGDDEHRRRLLTEAQALGRLDHPNVVTIHAVGPHDGGLFIAMEYASGGTLKDWLIANPVGSAAGRTQEALRLLIEAGRGVAAAHRAGLVHRDVKPSNILLAGDGRAQVADFGIARSLAAPVGRQLIGIDTDGLAATDQSGSGLTRTGTLVGTPAYMAPEQFGRGEVRAAADQFSYCVTAWELLFGVRPFGGTDIRARLGAIRRGELGMPEGVVVESTVVALLQRGLRSRPSARHRTMQALVDALERATGVLRPPQRRMRRWGLAIGSVGLLGTVGAYRAGQDDEVCAGGADVFERVWSRSRRETLRESLISSNPTIGAGVWARIESSLERYRDGWIRAHREACEATRAQPSAQASPAVERLACLNDAKRAVDDVLHVLASAAPGVVANEHELLSTLPPLEECTDSLSRPTQGERLALEMIARATVLRRGGDTRAALEVIGPLASSIPETVASDVGSRALLEYGQSLASAGSPDTAEVLERAYAQAHRLRDQSTAGKAARTLARVHATKPTEPSSVRFWYEVATAELSSPSTDELYEHKLLEGRLAELEGTGDAARSYEEAVDLAGGDRHRELEASRRLAASLAATDLTRAVEASERTLESFKTSFGLLHPSLPLFERSHAKLLGLAGRHSEGRRLSRRALKDAIVVWGPTHPALLPYMLQLSDLLCASTETRAEGTEVASNALRMRSVDTSTRDELTARRALGRCLLWGGSSAAVTSGAEVVGLTLSFHGEQSTEALTARAMYAIALLLNSEVRRAREQLHLSVSSPRDSRNPASQRDTMRSHELLATVADMLAEPTISAQHAVAAKRTRAESPERAAAIPAFSGLCTSVRLVGDVGAAETECEASASAGETEEHPLQTAIRKLELAKALRLQRRHQFAVAELRDAASIARDELGSNSYLFGTVSVETAEILESLGEYDEATQAFEAAYRALKPIPDAGVPRVRAGAGVARSLARHGALAEAGLLLEEVDRGSDQTSPLAQAYIAESRGFTQHLRDPRDGRAEYARAIHFYRFAHSPRLLREACESTPFTIEACGERHDPPH